MTPEAQRIAIAEACSWRCTASFKEAFACWVRPDGMDHQTEWLPDYLNDLNAMHEAEKRLSREQLDSYIFEMHEVIGHNHIERYVVTAAAAQRASRPCAGRSCGHPTGTGNCGAGGFHSG